MTIDANNRNHVEAGVKGGGQFAAERTPEQAPGLLATRRPALNDGAFQFARVAADAYDEVHGDTVADLMEVRDRMREVIYGEHAEEFGFQTNQESQHPSVQEYQRVTLAALNNHAVTNYPGAAKVVLEESDEELGSWGPVRVLDADGADISGDISLNNLDHGSCEVADLTYTFGMRSITSVEADAVTLTSDKMNGHRAEIDLTKAPHTLR